MDTTFAKHIEATTGVCGGKPRIAGSRIRVQDIYICHERHGMLPDEIVDAYPHITLADVHVKEFEQQPHGGFEGRSRGAV